VQTSVPCEQLVADVSEWGSFAGVVEGERVKVPVVRILKKVYSIGMVLCASPLNNKVGNFILYVFIIFEPT